MHFKNSVLSDFEIIRPPHEISQDQALNWIIAAHTKAETTKQNLSSDQQEKFHNELQDRLYRVGCKSNSIHKRGHFIDDFLHQNWDEMLVYRLEEHPEGINLQKRSAIFSEIVDSIFLRIYEKHSHAPNNIIHVSCTGYSSPSGAQKLVSKKNWGEKTTVTHAYHMGCYGAIPAIRMGVGFLHNEQHSSDIVHTELCTLHKNPLLHQSDKLVASSLFSDGFIKYSIKSEEQAKSYKTNRYFKIIQTHEEIIPNSLECMSWDLADWGFAFELSREIPVYVARSIKGFLVNLCAKANLDEKALTENSLFAIHPGGPKILEYAQNILGINEKQIAASRHVLQNYGNMSSATLPHIWELMLNDSNVKHGTKIISFAFGPGLTIAGNILEVVRQ